MNNKKQGMGFHHIGLKCADLKKSEEFYRAIGLTEVVRWGEGEKEIVMFVAVRWLSEEKSDTGMRNYQNNVF